MGQALRRGSTLSKQQKEELEISQLIEAYLNDNYKNLDMSIEVLSDFYHTIYIILEELSAKKGAMQFRMPSLERIRKEVDEVLKSRKTSNKDFPLTKEEVKEVIRRVISIENFEMGKASRDILLYLFGVPVVGLIAKRIIPGPTASIPDELFIPFVTSGTVIVLAKTHKL
ncbi:hypothetical protein AXF42_Ash009210 [Apostasia shenzhenica]|uniref:Uncharacterized protein n=1 Tax=Apostasia shenzhenica TaxID=1088818 RepID=A0A2I0ADT7_9ASPA|nr:hypothetical protein AXF42_Ash009210 [Apostasia shenzhenica]